jgi:hypothetical protein
MTRYFRTASDEVYDQARLTLDAAWGFPNPEGLTVTSITPAARAPRDLQGRILLGVRSEWCEYSVAVDLLPQLLASGLVEEIGEQEAFSSLPPPEV